MRAVFTALTCFALDPLDRRLYVASDLVAFEADPIEQLGLGRDLTQEDADGMRVYRRVDLYWFQCLNKAMERAQAAYVAGQHSEEAWRIQRDRFSRLWAWVRAHFDHRAMGFAAKTLPDSRYQPPALIPSCKGRRCA